MLYSLKTNVSRLEEKALSQPPLSETEYVAKNTNVNTKYHEIWVE